MNRVSSGGGVAGECLRNRTGIGVIIASDT